MGQAAVFLDRDGTINVDKGYVHKIEDWEWLPGAVEAIRSINRLAVPVIVVTNQAGIARGYYDEAAVHALHAHVGRALARQGAESTPTIIARITRNTDRAATASAASRGPACCSRRATSLA
jgi:histidinol-phosphate phosphatase family protein